MQVVNDVLTYLARSNLAKYPNDEWRNRPLERPFPRTLKDSEAQAKRRPDGKEIYYISPTGEDDRGADHGDWNDVGAVGAVGAVSHGVDNGQGRSYDVTRESRFLIDTVVDYASANHADPKLESRVEEVTLTAGTRLGPYKIVAQIGAGGMGEVFRRMRAL